MHLLGKQSNLGKPGQNLPRNTQCSQCIFQELWKLDLNALLFACISLDDPVLTLAALHGHELGTAVCFVWDVLGNLEGMEKEEDLSAQFTYIMVRVGIFAVGIMTCILTPRQCSLVNIFLPSFKRKKKIN